MTAHKPKLQLILIFFVSLFFFFPPAVFASESQSPTNKKPSIVASGLLRDVYCAFNWKRDSSCIDYRASSLSQNDNGILEEQVNIVSSTDNSGLTVLQVQMIKGDKGDKGDGGDNGEPGKDGRDGIDGTSGTQGIKGDKGDQGISGNGGAKGDKGDTGSGTSYTAGSGLSLSLEFRA